MSLTRVSSSSWDLTAYDATYVAFAEMTNATALLTTDARLRTATGYPLSR